MREKPLILIADDKQEFREIISAKLLATGFDCALAKNASEAIKKTSELLPDLILMDIRMPPGETGIEAALSIKEDPKTKDINIIFLTSDADPWPGIAGDKQMVSQQLGMQGFFDKGGNLDELAQKLKDAFKTVYTQKESVVQ